QGKAGVLDLMYPLIAREAALGEPTRGEKEVQSVVVFRPGEEHHDVRPEDLDLSRQYSQVQERLGNLSSRPILSLITRVEISPDEARNLLAGSQKPSELLARDPERGPAPRAEVELSIELLDTGDRVVAQVLPEEFVP